jgi:glycosyltransferase involved in cell wall biosynthesis
MPEVSVVITTFNGKDRGFLGEAVESVLNQTFKDFELIIVDDGSSDNTKSFCKKYLKNRNVRYFFQENRGVSAARNLGIKKSSGEYVAFLDDDDVWSPRKLEKQIILIDSVDDKQFGLCYTALEIIDSKGRKTGRVQSHSVAGHVWRDLLFENIVDCTSSVLIKKNCL